MNICTTSGCILFFFFGFLILPSSSTGADKITASVRHVLQNARKLTHQMWLPRLEHLGKYTHFYDTILLPMVQKCPPNGKPWDSIFGVKDRFYLDGEVKLCENVIELNELFTKLDKQNQMHKEGKHKPNMHGENDENDENFPQQIHDHILKHNKDVINNCSDRWTNKRKDYVDNEISQVEETREKLNREFKTKFYDLFNELKKPENAGNNRYVKDKETRRALAYQLLTIGDKMGHHFDTNEEEKMEWAFQLFAAQLAVYSFRLDSLPTFAHKKGAIIAIAQSWPIDMQMETEKPVGEASGKA